MIWTGIEQGLLTPANHCDILYATRNHWQRWRFCYEHRGPFADLPVLNDMVRFQGFLFEFSVGRGLEMRQIVPLADGLRLLTPDPSGTSIGLLLESISYTLDPQTKRKKIADTWKRVSLASKLLALWRPEQYPMWDRYVRQGLRAMHGSTKGHAYRQNNAETYDIFRNDFFDLLESMTPELETLLLPPDRSRLGFIHRFLDQTLLQLGKDLYRSKKVQPPP